ncbi:hypothetical protein PP180_09410 [Muricauda sp. SK9]|uniref:hypothetical protein n=1 Tax=Flavobacteriaceae TaxID=49546 RepID=UPI0011C43B79|nr:MULTISPECIES: hypothetical protein [Allomuricauda]MDC6385585.1 hypothetical protein [Muricauda sp. SK9]
MKYPATLLLALTVLFASCSSDGTSDPIIDDNEDPTGENPQEEEPKMVTYFTFEVLRSTADTDDWIIIHDENGNLLDFKQFEFDDTFDFQVMEGEIQPNNFTITLFSYTNSIEGEMLHIIKSYPNISLGSHWKYTLGPGANNYAPRNPSTGSFNVTVANVVSPKYQWISDRQGILVATSGPDLPGFTSTESHENIQLYDNPDFFYTIYDSSNDLKYYVIEDPTDGEEITLDYSDFKSFDSYLEVELPSTISTYSLSSISAVFDDDQPISLSGGKFTSYFFGDTNPPAPLKLGYLNSYSKYLSIISYNTDEFLYAYTKFGDKPDEIVIPENKWITVLNESIYNHEFETNLDFQLKDVLWEIKEGEPFVDLVQTTWNVYSSPDFSGTIGQIPEEIQEAYTNLRIEDLDLTSTSLHLDFITYPDLIQVEFIDPELKTYYKPHEYFKFKH